MYKILSAEALNPEVVRMVVEAPDVARKIQPGQFVMLRVTDEGERIPLTMNDVDREAGTVTIVAQIVGATTLLLSRMKAGDYLPDFTGPLGNPTEIEGVKKACIVAGGLGSAIAFSQAKALHDAGAHVDVIVGFRNKDLIILEDEFEKNSTNLIVTTDDGSNGRKALVTEPLGELLEEAKQAGEPYDLVLSIGPVIMMKFVAQLTKKYETKTLVSMNPLMIDGTGMCGGCRVRVGGEYMHACVDGPDFDGHLVDYDDAILRGTMYRSFEQRSMSIAEGRSCLDHVEIDFSLEVID